VPKFQITGTTPPLPICIIFYSNTTTFSKAENPYKEWLSLILLAPNTSEDVCKQTPHLSVVITLLYSWPLHFPHKFTTHNTNVPGEFTVQHRFPTTTVIGALEKGPLRLLVFLSRIRREIWSNPQVSLPYILLSHTRYKHIESILPKLQVWDASRSDRRTQETSNEASNKFPVPQLAHNLQVQKPQSRMQKPPQRRTN